MLGLKGLIAMIHERKNKPFKCNNSNARFALNSGLTNYVKGVHERMKPFKCDTYKLNFYIIASLKKHFQTRTFHEGKKSNCENCNISFD